LDPVQPVVEKDKIITGAVVFVKGMSHYSLGC
jgi:hypothetical protein